jgi:hypothetical protein
MLNFNLHLRRSADSFADHMRSREIESCIGLLMFGEAAVTASPSVGGYINALRRMVSSLTLRLRAAGLGRPCSVGARTATSVFVWAPGLAKAAARGARANFPCLTFGKFSGQALAGSNKSRRSREGRSNRGP